MKQSQMVRWGCAALGACLAFPMASHARRLIAVLDSTQNFGTTRRSVSYYDPDVSLDDPLFSVFVGFEGIGNFEEASAITVDPATGNTYVLAFDSGTAGNVVGGDTEGDFDLYRIDFQLVYSHWAANGNVYRFYSSGSVFDNSVPFAARTTLAGSIAKIGEVARNDSPTFYDVDLEFVDADTLLMLDNQTGADGVNDYPGYDHAVRTLKRVDVQPGQAQTSTTPSSDGGTPGDPTDDLPSVREGGWNSQTSESWESYVVRLVHLDFNPDTGQVAGRSEPIDFAYHEAEPTSPAGLTAGFAPPIRGVWIMEDDGDGDDVAFLEISDFGPITDPLNGATNPNRYREQAVGPGPDFPTSFALDDDPCIDPTANDGSGDFLLVSSAGNLVIGESGFFNVPQHEPKVILREVQSYDEGNGRIDFGAWTCLGPLDMTGLPDDDQAVTDGRFVTWDEDGNELFIFDIDSGSPPAVIADVYTRDTLTGASGNLVMDGPNHFLQRHGIRFFAFNSPCDFDNDGDVDGDDADFMANCATGPDVPAIAPGCEVADRDADGDIDQSDWARCQICSSGDGLPADPECGL